MMKKCCTKCFVDRYAIKHVRKHGILGTCDFCKSTRVKTIEAYKLNYFFEVLLKSYEETSYGENFHPEMGIEAIDVGDTLARHIQDDWEIFSEALNDEQINDLLDEIREYERSEYHFMIPSGEWWTRSDKNFCHVTEEELWYEFTCFIKHKKSFNLSKYTGYNPEDDFPHYLSHCKLTLPEGTIMFRARVGCNADNSAFSGSAISSPPPACARAGRANPKGTPYLYLGDSEETCLAEARVKTGKIVSVGKFRANMNVRILDLIDLRYLKNPFARDLNKQIQRLHFLQVLSKELSKPVVIKPATNYKPTQYLAYLIKKLGYHGIKYKSSKHSSGYNIVIFDGKRFDYIESWIVRA